jgi:hypothetical protein
MEISEDRTRDTTCAVWMVYEEVDREGGVFVVSGHCLLYLIQQEA